MWNIMNNVEALVLWAVIVFCGNILLKYGANQVGGAVMLIAGIYGVVCIGSEAIRLTINKDEEL